MQLTRLVSVEMQNVNASAEERVFHRRAVHQHMIKLHIFPGIADDIEINDGVGLEVGAFHFTQVDDHIFPFFSGIRQDDRSERILALIAMEFQGRHAIAFDSESQIAITPDACTKNSEFGIRICRFDTDRIVIRIIRSRNAIVKRSKPGLELIRNRAAVSQLQPPEQSGLEPRREYKATNR